VILTIALVIILAIVVWFFPSNDDFQAENPFWNGTKDIIWDGTEDTSSIIPALPLASLSDLPSSPEGATLILIPYLNLTTTELGELSSFVTQGGTLVLAYDYGHGNQVLEYLGLQVRFSGHSLLDPWVCHGNHWFPRIRHITASSITTNVESLLLNHATCLTGVENGDVLALSSVFSFLDLNDNESWDEVEPGGPLPVISHHNLGSGKIILISDPSIFINTMSQFENNLTFIQNIAAVTASEVFIDQSHLPTSNLRPTKNLLAAIRDSLTTPVGAVTLVIVALSITLVPIWYRRRQY